MPVAGFRLLLLEDADGNATAVIGSANASARSRDALLEAAVVSDDESLCEAVHQELAFLAVIGAPDLRGRARPCSQHLPRPAAAKAHTKAHPGPDL